MVNVFLIIEYHTQLDHFKSNQSFCIWTTIELNDGKKVFFPSPQNRPPEFGFQLLSTVNNIIRNRHLPRPNGR